MDSDLIEQSFELTVRDFRNGKLDEEALSLAFCRTVFFCRRGEEIAFQALGEPGRGMVPLYSSESALARSEGECAWFSGTGAQLIALVPVGYGAVVDLGSDSQVALAPWAIHSQGPAGISVDVDAGGS
jgi:hypothetical protein